MALKFKIRSQPSHQK